MAERVQGIDPAIESAYADIGRAVVEAAMAKSGNASGMNEAGEVDVDVTLRLKVDQSQAAGMRSMICCVCTIDESGVVTCKGGCCQYD
ncbi:MAG: hypothetical protein AB7V46_02615 [Thermomicrobiales bacterium]